MEDKITIKSGIRKIWFAIITQALILVCSLVTSLVIPKYMGKETYGYWQIYYFYLNYINFITFGYNDGIVLKYGGVRKEELPIERIRRGNLLMLFSSMLVAVIGVILLQLLKLPAESRLIFSALFASMPFVSIFNIISSLFLAINQQEKYNILNFANRFVATVGYCVLLFAGIRGYVPMIGIDYAVRILISLICAAAGVYFWLGKKSSWNEGWKEVKENCGGGIFITLGALCASFAPLAGRVVLEHNASIEEYALFSFAMSILSLVVTFTNAAGVVFFPMLKRLKSDDMLQYYNKIKEVYNYLIVAALFCYLPAVLVVRYYLVEYMGALQYAYLLVALCVPLGKLQILITPYMKAYRLEKEYFVGNLIGAFVVWLSDWVVFSLTSGVFWVALTTLVVYEIWCIGFEWYLGRKIGLSRIRNGREVLILVCFIGLTVSGKMTVFVIGYVAFALLLAAGYWRKRKHA